MTEHILKTTALYFDAIERGDKTFEVRRNDRAYQAGDILMLARVQPDEFKPHVDPRCSRGCCMGRRWLRFRVTYVFAGDPSLRDLGGVIPGYVVLGLGVTGDE